MTDGDLSAFMDVFRSLQRVFPLRGESHELQDVGASYFKALRKWPLREVQWGAEAWLLSGKRFPKPAEWIESIPRRTKVIDIPILSDAEARIYRRAEELRYEDAPCGCAKCVEAGVHERPLRFVPEFTEADTDRKVKDPIGDRIVTAGHWAHGWELARYYQTRGDFWAKYFEMSAKNETKSASKRHTFQQRIDQIFAPKPRADRSQSDLEPVL